MTNDLASFVAFILDELNLALPLSVVDRVIPAVAISPLPNAPAIVSGIINIHGQMVPVMDLRRRLARQPRALAISDQMVLLTTPTRRLAITVDSVNGLMEYPLCTVTAMAHLVPDLPHIQGVTRLDDGMLLICDVESFLSQQEEEQLAFAMECR